MRSASSFGWVAVACLVLAACGSSGPSFVARANAICAKANERIEALPAPGNTLADYLSAVRAEIPLVRHEISRLATIRPPTGKRGAFAQTIADGRADVALAGETLATLERGQRSELGSLLTESATLDANTLAEAGKLRIEACGRSGLPQGKGA